LPDATDWVSTPLRAVAEIEASLHCQICKEFFATPMTTSCAHTFCSKCIRTSLSADGKCPTCRAQDQASKLRHNWALEDVVDKFLNARPAMLAVARGKRARERYNNVDIEEMYADKGEGGRTRKSRRIAVKAEEQTEEHEENALVECPLGCGKRMQIALVDGHLDRCEDEQREAKMPPPPPPERLAELNYSLLKENALRRKLEELGIPSWGNKLLMTKRHVEWTNLWNANCDSTRPRSKKDLLKDLNGWERSQGGRAAGGTSAVARKDFDASGWAEKNKDEFVRLVAAAR
ncbi:DNA repair protein rad18, partial [Piedraia hortae CBS 480.64]